MAQIYDCTNQSCEYCPYLRGPGEVIEHLRKEHKLSFISRPQMPGASDAHGNIWYCKRCVVNKLGKDHRSFQSDRAMWDHLNSCHDYELDEK
jgi:hypothetical protein